MHEGYIYLITNNVNGKQYVGQTIRTIEERYKAHLRKSKNNKDNLYLYTAMNKYGANNFMVKEIEKIICSTKKELSQLLNEKEIYYIKAYNTRKPNGYNMTDGGILLTNTFEKKPVCTYDLERNLVDEFESISEGARYYNISQSDISYCCQRKKLNVVNGLIWRFKGDDYDVKTLKLRTRVVCQYDFAGNFIRKYNGIQEAKRITGINNISGCCNGKYKSAGSYVWRFLGDAFNKYELPKCYTIDMYDSSKNFIKSFSTISEASKITGIKSTDILRACNNDNATADGYFWVKSTDDISKKHLSSKSKRLLQHKNEKIYLFDTKNNLLNIYEDIYDASEQTGYSITKILDHCDRKYKICDYKYIFKYEQDVKQSA